MSIQLDSEHVQLLFDQHRDGHELFETMMCATNLDKGLPTHVEDMPNTFLLVKGNTLEHIHSTRRVQVRDCLPQQGDVKLEPYASLLFRAGPERSTLTNQKTTHRTGRLRCEEKTQTYHRSWFCSSCEALRCPLRRPFFRAVPMPPSPGLHPATLGHFVGHLPAGRQAGPRMTCFVTGKLSEVGSLDYPLGRVEFFGDPRNAGIFFWCPF